MGGVTGEIVADVLDVTDQLRHNPLTALFEASLNEHDGRSFCIVNIPTHGQNILNTGSDSSAKGYPITG